MAAACLALLLPVTTTGNAAEGGREADKEGGVREGGGMCEQDTPLMDLPSTVSVSFYCLAVLETKS